MSDCLENKRIMKYCFRSILHAVGDRLQNFIQGNYLRPEVKMGKNSGEVIMLPVEPAL
jgi:hypothetical protein